MASQRDITAATIAINEHYRMFRPYRNLVARPISEAITVTGAVSHRHHKHHALEIAHEAWPRVHDHISIAHGMLIVSHLVVDSILLAACNASLSWVPQPDDPFLAFLHHAGVYLLGCALFAHLATSLWRNR